ncbi:unnamed protein product [Caenorhabditis bovis]|uniref:Uncharacterized protein n=1 Tax=Caenorhabditis bovis TaxID=2654633 RepID=A0A8S1EVC9_9PELO|nr:unnamed protein product [Caenorhabditis bovis]
MLKSIAIIAVVLLSAANAKDGIDFIQAVSASTFNCLRTNGISFVIPRVFTSLGSIDGTGVNNVKNAHAGGITDVGAYLFPCLSSRCPSAATQVRNTISRLRAEKTTINYLWLDIERLAWPANHASNRKFIEEMVNEAKALNQPVGIYSNYYNWEEIVGLDYHGLSYLPLWWATYDNKPGFQDFKPFGGWTKPLIHQWKGTTNGKCGVSVDLNYKA